jgi:DNA adenine methylase
MKIKAIAPWYGGKRTLAPVIVEEAGNHRAWWDQFCGGVSILLQKPRVRQECLNDLHGDLTNLAMVLASPRVEELYNRARRTLYSEELYDACRILIETDAIPDFAVSPFAVTDVQVDRAYAYLVLCWMGRNGAAGTARLNYQFTLRYTNNGGDSATRWVEVANSIPAWHDRLAGVVISRRDGLELLEKIDDAEGCVIYLDPPYIEEGDAYEHSFAVGSGGMFDHRDDHARLADLARGFKRSRVIISYYDHPRLPELYPGWVKRAMPMQKNLAVQNKRGAGRETAPEVLLINGPSYATSKPAPARAAGN